MPWRWEDSRVLVDPGWASIGQKWPCGVQVLSEPLEWSTNGSPLATSIAECLLAPRMSRLFKDRINTKNAQETRLGRFLQDWKTYKVLKHINVKKLSYFQTDVLVFLFASSL